MMNLPDDQKIIWIFWSQGFDAAPPLVRLCLESWRPRHPGWTIRELDQTTVWDYVTLPPGIPLGRKDMDIQKISTIIRLMLLKRYGGIWVDATLYCLIPLDAWIDGCLVSGFFAFSNPGPDRLMSNWFIASRKDNPLLAAMHDRFISMWENTIFANQNNKFMVSFINKISPLISKSPRRTLFWTNGLVQKILRAYPYFIFHYCFNRIVLRDRRCHRIWAESARWPADPPHHLQFLGDEGGDVEAALWFIREAGAPVFKLNWRVDDAGPYWRPVLEALAAALPPADSSAARSGG